MNEDQRHTVQLIVGSVYGAAIIGAVIYLGVTAQGEGERNLLLGILGGGFGAAVSMFLGNVVTPQKRTAAGPTVNVDTAGDVNATAAPPHVP